LGKAKGTLADGRVPISSGYQIEIGFGGGVGNLFFGAENEKGPGRWPSPYFFRIAN
jgi:hypothetical protein